MKDGHVTDILLVRKCVKKYVQCGSSTLPGRDKEKMKYQQDTKILWRGIKEGRNKHKDRKGKSQPVT